MKFGVHGKFELPRKDGGIDDTVEGRRSFWVSVDEEVDGLSRACGCYVFAAQNRPWYVGKTEKQDFAHECLTPHKILHYNHVIVNKYNRAAPHLYLFPLLTPRGKFSAPSRNGHRTVAELERMLIAVALSRNTELLNIEVTKFLKGLHVPGLFNTKRGDASAYSVQEVRSLFDLG